jgi:DNA helicase-2/ATP-dependent DNA helicase PcrA
VDNHGRKEWNVTSSEFDFIEPDNKKLYQKRKLVITPEDTAIVTRQITDTWKKIQDNDFYIGCGSKDCHYCNFIKTNELHIDLHEVEEEEIQINA